MSVLIEGRREVRMRKTKIRGLSPFNPPISEDQKQGVEKAGDLEIFVGEYGFSYDPGINTDSRLNPSVKVLVNKGLKGKRKNTLCFFPVPAEKLKLSKKKRTACRAGKTTMKELLLQP
ncbi:hypothetical protein AVEN_110543-1 [Araneus ventricosus]|uniref:Uncharacterized protein n=1 Tax=Araneus ventricosus TaxID=182803 RepID=A0A4Y2WYQ0_ARAVE|nr:hypothetical protein AVEN_244897-1 [Araneus ventricosus]GBO41933.1 hypothetical protein AVEN_256869-1 [Araneus ventricosus]GBO41936.1 hypothetical protein AVEN_93228-1 [Araneus ventricosus]GBO41937.1 hypothetical protein AVEN_110543-1 [Araneus ventricosus]